MMTLTYLDDLSRVRIEIAPESPGSPSSPPDIEHVTIERSINEVVWSTVRGAVDVQLADGELAAPVDDYEFVDGVANFYRVRLLEDEESPSSPSSPDDDVLFDDAITPDLEGRIWLKGIRYPFLNRPVTVTDWTEVGRLSRGGLFEVSARSVPVSVTDVRGSRGFLLELLTEGAAAERDMDLILAAGTTMFVHIPAGCPVPGGYVDIGDLLEERRATRSDRRYWLLPCRIAAQPGPDVVGTTLVWSTVLRLYGSAEQLLASNPTWTELFQTISDPEDLVTL